MGSHVSLSVREIEDAGVLEILQAPGAALGSWKILDALLDPSVATFSFREPLGHAREVKTALSGLFGRFVARAYATRFLGMTHFSHVLRPPMRLAGALRGELRRVPGMRGDMPDWVTWGPTAGLAIVEAKGCHDPKGPGATLKRGYQQAERAEIVIRGRTARFKRFAIATRWGFSSPKITRPMLWVQDPEVGEPLTPDESAQFEVGMARWHAATLLAPLGFESLASALVQSAQAIFPNGAERARRIAREALNEAPNYRLDSEMTGPDDLLIGGFVTRAGPIVGAGLSQEEQAILMKHKLAPTFVGIERRVLKRAIEGIPSPPTQTDGIPAPKVAPTKMPGEDGAGSWVVHLEADRARVERVDSV